MLQRCLLARSCTTYVPRHWEPSSLGKALIDNNVHRSLSSSREEVTRNFRSIEKAVMERDREKEGRGFFALPELDYDVSNGIPPLCSREQFEMQYFFFHKDAVERLNTHVIGSELEGHNLDVVLRHTAFDATRAVIHSAAAEHFNYCFWYKSLRPWGTSVPSRLSRGLQEWRSAEKSIKASVKSLSSSPLGTANRLGMLTHGSGLPALQSFDSDPVKEITRSMTIKALTQVHRMGWVYLVWTGKKFDVLYFQHGLCPISSDIIPLLCLNINEAGFWVDYGAKDTEEDRFEDYVSNFFKTCNWIVVDRNFGAAIEKLP